MVCLLGMGTGPNLVKSSFLSRSCQANVKHVKVSAPKNGTREAVSVQGRISLHIYIRDLHARGWYGIIEHITVDPRIEPSFIEK